MFKYLLGSLVVYGTYCCPTTRTAPEDAMYLYKIVTPEQWQQSKGQKELVLTPDDTAFVHFSTDEQVDQILAKILA